MNTELKNNIHWVGKIDWTVRDFHGYTTRRGSTYNSYLVQDDKTAVIDTVKAPYAEELIEHISALVDPARIDYVVANHAEPDHAGSLPRLIEACPNAEILCDQKCRDALEKHVDISKWTLRIVKDGDSVSLGKRTLSFVETPMVHWPESMFTYVPEEKLLFSMDAFGQHYASSHRFDDEEPMDVVMQEAKTYYANILMLYGNQISRVLDRAAQLELDMVAPSHGIIWRSHFDRIVAAYRDWVVCKPAAKVLVLYDTMWQSTAGMAKAILEGALSEGVEARLYDVREEDVTLLATETLDSAALAVGSPTLNMTLMPKVAGVLAYLKGLKPKGKCAFAFGSYGWSKAGGPAEVNKILESMKLDVVREPLVSQYRPDDDKLAECFSAGKELAQRARTLAGD